MGEINAWHKIFNHFKKIYPRQARRVERFRPLTYPEIEVIFRDGSSMIYNDAYEKARILSSETIYDRMSDVDESEIYSTITEEDYARVFSLNIDEIMYRKKMSAAQLSEITGIPYRTVRRYVNGEYIPDVLEALRISEALGCSIADLILLH